MGRITRRLALLGALAIGQRMSAQQQLSDNTVAGPRFLYAASSTRTVAVDVSKTPTLKRQLSLDLDGRSVKEALAIISERSGMDIAYGSDAIPFNPVLHLKADGITVAAALTDVLADESVDVVFSRDGRATIVRRGAAVTVGTTGTVVGRVTDARTNDPIRHVMVRLEGAPYQGQTDQEGAYKIPNVSPGTYAVIIRLVGYASARQSVVVRADAATSADFALQPVAVQLSQVVSIGYGTTTRRDVTGAVATVTADQLTRAPIPEVDQALEGQAAGVQVTTSSGQPGAPAVVRIRGGNSITAGNDPLYVIDGVPVTISTYATVTNTNTLETQGVQGTNPLDAINPEDIESIDVLKDASATAIYGARAANGVILITTKRGQTGHPKVNIAGYYGSATVNHKLSLLDGQQFATEANLARTNAGQPVLYSPTQVAAFGQGTNWENAIFRTAPTSSFDASVGGGTPATRYFVSGNILDQYGVVLGTDLTRGAFRANLDQDFGSKFRMNSGITVSRSQADIMPNGGNGEEVSSVILNALQANPTLPVYSTTGPGYNLQVDPANGRVLQNPVAEARLITNQETQDRVLGNVNMEWDLWKGLTLGNSLGVDYLNSLQDYYSPSTTYPGLQVGGIGSRGSLLTTTWLDEPTLKYATAIGPFSAIDAVLGTTFQRTNAQNISGEGQGFVTDALGVNGLNSAQTFNGVWSGNQHSSLESYFGRANATLLDRFLFSASGRFDGSSKFGPNNQWAFFPAGAIAYRLSEERPIKDLHIFDDLKLRVSYGQTGNQDIANYLAFPTEASTTYQFGNVKAGGYGPTTLANPDLKWETTTQFDAGFDLAVIKNRVAITADYYNKVTKDLLLLAPVSSVLGVTYQQQNVGSVSNIGYELGVNTVNLTGVVGWTTSLNLAWNKNKVLSLVGGDTIIIAPQIPTGQPSIGNGANQNPTVLKVGQPINSWYGYVYAGMQNGQPVYKNLTGGSGPVGTASQTIIGNAQPDYTGGLTNRFTAGPFGLTVFLTFSVGGHIYNINRSLLTSNDGTGNQLTDVQHGGTNGIPVAMIGNTFDTRPSTLFVEDGTFLRGKNIRLDFNVPSSWLRAVRMRHVDHLQVYASAQNFFTVTKYSGFDPEVTEYATSPIAQGIDFGTYPQTRQFTFGLNAGF
jgi:TonB-dependent starch-binding outer membrane protein SusC